MAKKIGLKTKTPMPCADPRERSHAFTEVALGYTAEMAQQEADRCIQCKNRPCVAGCPVGIDIPAFVHLQRKITTHREAIDAALDTGLSQGLIESTNTKIRLLTRVAFGFRSPEALIAMAMLAVGGCCPSLPGRN